MVPKTIAVLKSSYSKLPRICTLYYVYIVTYILDFTIFLLIIMSVPSSEFGFERHGLEQVMRGVIQEMKKGTPMTIAKLSRALGVDRRTISTVIDMLLDIQNTLVEKQIETERRGRAFVISFKERTKDLQKRLKSSLKGKVKRRRTKRST
ncbi:MAG: hypothetical protein BAJATHORv1_10395 [Candidatus Thorarchaeota archaeon]|nr:MAG: hypothetical protein BAJATHORv1_10395 [Candidatus Thorarchaeota archaeon]